MDISIIIPCYNTAAYIEECLTSVVYHDCVKELIVIDDCSTDETAKIIERQQLACSKIKLFKNPRNKGRSYSRNLGILNASFPWIGFCDSDDYYLASRFDELQLMTNLSFDGIYSNIQTLYTHHSHKILFEEQITGITNQIKPSDLFEFLILNSKERFSLNGLIIRRNALINVGLFDTNLSLGEDTDLIWRLALNYSLISDSQDRPVAIRRIHDGNAITDNNRMALARFQLYKKWSNQIQELSANKLVIGKIYSGLYSNKLAHLKLNYPLIWIFAYMPLKAFMFFISSRS